MQDILKDDDLITVCAACSQASCWHGDFMCEEAMTADITQKTVKELKELNLEHPEHWAKQVRGESIKEEIIKKYGSADKWRLELYENIKKKEE